MRHLPDLQMERVVVQHAVLDIVLLDRVAKLLLDLLSKRTDVYLQGMYQHVGGDSSGSVLDAAYVAGAANVSSNQNQLLLRLGVRHFF